MSWRSLTSAAAYKSPAFIALVAVLCVALALLLHHLVVTACCRASRSGGGGGGGAERRRRRQGHHRHRHGGNNNGEQQQDEDEDEEVSISVEVSAATSRTHLVKAASASVTSSPAVVLPYRKEEPWKESTCPVCLADFDDGEVVRVLPECMHYFHAECIDTWLRGSTSCPMCRAETTPTPSPGSLHHQLDLSVVSVSLEEILVRT
ncbi:hypothetical protein HU200_065197 [Digitaria exilis]|uniref:RING-type domain-containing protein n=1 Tax=Digitaria exilis TaxID=1010633 RepID=A0A835A4E9_9POAL|nr:hypothetical protein HU200_065197 [Digitaria exilis]